MAARLLVQIQISTAIDPLKLNSSKGKVNEKGC
jgi:hypothetical protein